MNSYLRIHLTFNYFVDFVRRRTAIHEEVRSVKKAAFRPGTQKNLRTQLRSYLLFCSYYEYNPFPCRSEILCDYLCFLSYSLRSTASIKNYLSGLKTWSQLLGHDMSAFDNYDIRLTSQGLTKISSHVPRSRLPFTFLEVREMITILDTSQPLEACMWVFLTFGFFGMLRASNLLCNTVKSFNKAEQLTRCQVHFCSEGLKLHIYWSKTRQGHDFLHIVPIARSTDPYLCPFKAYVNLLDVISGDIDSPVMAVPLTGTDSSQLIPVTKTKMLPLFNQLLYNIGLSSYRYSFHSLRHGGATLAAHCGVSELMLMTHGDWRTTCYQTYIKNIHINSFAVSKKMYQALK